MEAIPISKARENLFSLVDRTIQSHKPIAIASKRGSVVLIAEEDWEAIQETLYLNSIPGLAQSIIDAANDPNEEFISIEELDRELASLNQQDSKEGC